MPAQDAVLAMTGGLADMPAVLTAAWENLLPGFDKACAKKPCSDTAKSDDAATTPGTQADAGLAARLAALAYPPPTGVPGPDAESALNGKRFKLRDNPQNLQEICLQFGADSCAVDMMIKDTKSSLRLGREQWIAGTYSEATVNFVTPRTNFPVAAAFAWEKDGALTITMRDLGGPTVYTYRLVFKGDRMAMSQCVNVSFGPLEVDFVGSAE